jgi:hypothetical protein
MIRKRKDFWYWKYLRRKQRELRKSQIVYVDSSAFSWTNYPTDNLKYIVSMEP